MPDITVTREGIATFLLNLNPNNAVGPDEIKSRLLKKLAIETAHNLTLNFHMSLESDFVPSGLKTVHVAPVY